LVGSDAPSGHRSPPALKGLHFARRRLPVVPPGQRVMLAAPNSKIVQWLWNYSSRASIIATSGKQGTPGLKFAVEILKLDGEKPPEVLHRFAHSASSIHMIKETMKAVLKSPQWPSGAQGFRIMGDDGLELYRWPEPAMP
jgi:hypothetical protein